MTSTVRRSHQPLRRRMIEDMSIRKFSEKTRYDYIRHIEPFAKFLNRSPDTATAEDLGRYQVHQTERDFHPPAMNSSVQPCASFSRSRSEVPTSPLGLLGCITHAGYRA